MKRALQLSSFGAPMVSPNPYVGAVIMAEGRIIGEGYHRLYGEAHAEVNAIASVKDADRPLLSKSTMYVTLEPCSHFGKTPPCADLIICTGIPHVVVAAEDPFLKDYESGIDRMRRAGVEVEVGLLRDEARWINRRFFTAHERKRPYVLLKWAQSADGFIALPDGKPVKLSSDFTSVLMHRERALYDAILVGTDTILNDHPRLDCRLWPVRDPEHRPLKVTFDSKRLPTGAADGFIMKPPEEALPEFLHRLYEEHKVTSLMVEGGAKTIESFIQAGIYDEIRVETSSRNLLAGIPSPFLPQNEVIELSREIYGNNLITCYGHHFNVKG